MSIRDLLTAARETLVKPTETAVLSRLLSRLDEVLASIEAVQVADKITPAQALARLEWRIALFPFELFAELARSTPRALHPQLHDSEQELRRLMTTLAQAIESGSSPQLVEARAGLVPIRAGLEALAFQLQRGSFSSRLLRNTLVMSSLAAALSAVYLRSDLGMRLLRIEGLQPAVAYRELTTPDADLLPRDDYLEHFLAEFSKHYFGHPSQFLSLYFDKPKDGKSTQRRSLLHKISLRNASHGQVRYVSSVDAVVQAEGPAEFPWRRLTVTPKVSVLPSAPSLPGVPLLKSEGIGPALDVSWEWRAQSGLLISQQTLPVFLRTERVAYPRESVSKVQVAAGGLVSPLFFKRTSAPSPHDPQRHLFVGPGMSRAGLPADCPAPPESQHGWYDILTTPAALRAVTEVGHDEPWTLAVRYRALDTAHETVSQHAGRLRSDLAYYQQQPRLFDHDPRCGDGPDKDSVIDATEGSPLESLAMIFADEKAIAQPKGVDLLTARLGLDLYQAPVGSRIAAAAELDGFLNPQGILAVYLTLNMPDRLRYQVTLRVNGQPAASYRFAGLTPEFLDFHSEGEAQAVARLRKVFGVPNR